MAIAALFYVCGFGLLFFCGSPPAVIVSTAIWTIGEILSATNSQVFIAELTPSTHRGRVNAFVAFVMGGGAALGPVTSGAYAARFGSRAIWPAVSAVALVSAVFMILIARGEKLRQDRFQRRRTA
jgi:MFS family permease